MLSLDLAHVIGLSAGFLTTVSFLPQVMQVWRTRSTHDISLGMYLIFVTGVALWLCYGIVTYDIPVIIANSITLLLAGAVLLMKVLFDQRTQQQQQQH